MKSQQRPSPLAFVALLVFTLQQTPVSSTSHGRISAPSPSSSSSPTTSPSEVRSRNDLGTSPNWLKQTNISRGNHGHKIRPLPKLKELPGSSNGFSNSSAGDVTTARSEKLDGALRWSLEDGASSLCAYRVMEGGVGGPLCFRHTLFGYKCQKGDCRAAVSRGNLVANILINGSVQLQWSDEPATTQTKEAAAVQKSTGSPRTRWIQGDVRQPGTVLSGRRHRRGGYELSCWWNGSYTQFECAGVRLGSGCRDFLLTELHENIPYRLCLRTLSRSDAARKAERQDCVEFTLPPSGMQDIVIAMTTVGGAICVMLVIICLLVAYITENIMSPTTQHTYSYCTHSRH